jgi:hypothetical protein
MNVQPEQTVDDVLKSMSAEDDVIARVSVSNLPTSSVFPNILVVKNDIEDWTSTSPPIVLSGGHFDTCPLLLTGVDQQTEVHVHFDFDPEILSTTLSQIVMDQLVHVLNCIQANPEMQLKTLLDMSPNGPKQAQGWSSRLQLRRQELGLHDVITKSEESPNPPPVCEWDGKSDQSQLSAVAWTEPTGGEVILQEEETPPTSRDSSLSPSQENFEKNPEHNSNEDSAVIAPKTISETFSCTQTQQWLLNNHEGGCFVLGFSGLLDQSKLEAACRLLMESHTALRSVFTCIDRGLVQTVLKEFDLPFTVHSDASQHPMSTARNLSTVDPENTFPVGTVPLCFTLITGSKDQSALMIQLSQTQYDSFCQEALVSDLCQLYQNPTSPINSNYAPFAHEVIKQQTPESFDFWSNLLSGSSITEISNTAPQMQSKNTVLRCSTKVTIKSLPDGITMSSMIKTAWSEVLRQETEEDDIVFAQLVNLRSMDVPDIHRTVGMCSNRVPVRVQYGQCKTRLDLLRAVENQHTQTVPFQAAEWENIVSRSTNWAVGSKPQSLVIHQGLSAETDIQMGDDLHCHSAEYIPIESMIDSLKLYSEELQDGMLKLTLAYSSHFVPKSGINGLLGRLRNTLMLFTDAPESMLAS